MITGQKQVLVRQGFSDYAAMGSGNYACAATGNLDAPDFMPQGSIRTHSTIRPNPCQSVGHRDWETGMPIGTSHDGPEAGQYWDGPHPQWL